MNAHITDEIIGREYARLESIKNPPLCKTKYWYFSKIEEGKKLLPVEKIPKDDLNLSLDDFSEKYIEPLFE